MKPYHPSGHIPFGGLVGVLLATMIGSLVIGGLVFAVSHLIYLVILFPFMMGALGGAILTLAVKRGKVRSPIFAGLFGLVIGVGIVGVNRFAEYEIDFHNQARDAILDEAGGDIPQDQVDEFIDAVLEDETGSPGFIGYLKYSAQQGTTLSRSTGSSELTLDETGTWVYWGIELLIVMGLSAGMAFKTARQPFNEEADDWYPTGEWIGSVDWKQRKEFYRLLKEGDTLSAFKMVTGTKLSAPRVDIQIQRIPVAPQSNMVLNVKETRLNRKREVTADKMKGLLSPTEFSTLSRMTGVSLGTPISAVGSAPVIESTT